MIFFWIMFFWSRRVSRIIELEKRVEELYSWRREDIRKVLSSIDKFETEGEATEDELEFAKALRLNLSRRGGETFNG